MVKFRALMATVLCLGCAQIAQAYEDFDSLKTRGSWQWGDWHGGAELTLGFPHPAQLGTEWVTGSGEFSVGLGAGYFPYSMNAGVNSNAVSLEWFNTEVRARWHPYKGAFYFGVTFGRHWFTASTRDTVPLTPFAGSMPVDLRLDFVSQYVTPHLGWCWIFKYGLMVGFEAGLQRSLAPVAPWSVTSSDPLFQSWWPLIEQTSNVQGLRSEIDRARDLIAKLNVPVVAFRLGWMF